jgi:hypothetical protein
MTLWKRLIQEIISAQGSALEEQYRKSRPPGEASTSSPERINWKVQNEKDGEWKGADTDQKIKDIGPREQKFLTPD